VFNNPNTGANINDRYLNFEEVTNFMEERIIVIGYVTKEMILNDGVIFFQISKEEVKNKDYDRVDKMFILLQATKKHGRNRILMHFDYDDDPREIYEINEINLYISRIYEKYPFLFYYLVTSERQFMPFMLSLMGVKIVEKNTHTTRVEPIDFEKAKEVRNTIAQNILDYCKKLDDLEGAKTLLSNIFADN